MEEFRHGFKEQSKIRQGNSENQHKSEIQSRMNRNFQTRPISNNKYQNNSYNVGSSRESFN